MTNSFNIIMAARKVLSALPIWVSSQHIPAHHKTSRGKMDIWGRSNDDCYEEANTYCKWGAIKEYHYNLDRFMMNRGWTLWLGEEKISTHV
jgi:hypothetical protein